MRIIRRGGCHTIPRMVLFHLAGKETTDGREPIGLHLPNRVVCGKARCECWPRPGLHPTQRAAVVDEVPFFAGIAWFSVRVFRSYDISGKVRSMCLITRSVLRTLVLALLCPATFRRSLGSFLRGECDC